MITLVYLLVALGVVFVTMIVVDGRRTGARQLKADNRELRAALNRVESDARDNYELSPTFAQVIIDDVNEYHRKRQAKELGK